jgi:hypothetical protein
MKSMKKSGGKTSKASPIAAPFKDKIMKKG